MTYAKTSKRSNAALRVSIVIPVYNEAERIGDCLRAIAAQTIRPYEVIVVDNNSTDTSAAIAAQFPFVTLVPEPRQGVIYARRRGFDEARGDIIGSLDADTDIPVDWICTVRDIFTETNAYAVAGTVQYRDIALTRAVEWFDLTIRRYFVRHANATPLQGANMAIRRSVWRVVRGSLCVQAGVHEDLDLAIHLGELGRSARFEERLRVVIGSRQCALNWRNFYTYAAANPRSYSRHGQHTSAMWCVVMFGVSVYPLLYVLHQGCDRTRQKFSLRQLLRYEAIPHVNPVTFVD